MSSLRRFRHVRRGIFGLGDEIKCPQSQGLHGDRRPFGAVRAEHDHRHRMTSHDFFQRVDAVHFRHFQIERHHAGLQLRNLLQTERCRPSPCPPLRWIRHRPASAESASASAPNRRPPARAPDLFSCLASRGRSRVEAAHRQAYPVGVGQQQARVAASRFLRTRPGYVLHHGWQVEDQHHPPITQN